MLLAAGRSEFARHGFAGARTERIARAARVNKALIRYHFGGKRGLYNALLRDGLSSAGSELERLSSATLPAEDPRSAATRLGRLVVLFARFIERESDLGLILVREQMDGARNLERSTADALFTFFATTRALLERGIAAGELRRLDPHHVHLALVGSLVYFRITAPAREAYAKRGVLAERGTSPLTWPDHVAAVATILSHGLVRSESEGPPTSASV